MQFEKIRRINKSKLLVGGVVALGLISTFIYLPSMAKYKLTESINIANGVVNYKVPDLNVVAMYTSEDGVNYAETAITPSSGYLINEEKSYCNLNGVKDDNIIIKTINNMVSFANLQKGSKCYIYFDKLNFNLVLNDYIFSWDNMKNASKYNIYSDNNFLMSTTETSAEIWDKYSEEGSYNIKVAAVVDNIEIFTNNTIAYNIEKAEPKVSTLKGMTPNYYGDGSVKYDILLELSSNEGYINFIDFNMLHADNPTATINELFAIFKDNDNFCNENARYCGKMPIKNYEHIEYNYAGKTVCGYTTYFDSSTNQLKMKFSGNGCPCTSSLPCYNGYSMSHELNQYAIQAILPGKIPSSWLYGNVSNYCLDENSLAYVYDRRRKRFKKKKLKNLTYDDEILVWDFDNGCFTTAKPLWIAPSQTAYKYNILKFSNGSILKTLLPELGHRIFNKEKGMFTYPMTDDTPLGTTTFTASGEEAKLISREIVEGEIRYTNIITEYHMNIFTNDILTSCRLNNIYPIKNMKFVKDNRELRDSKEFKNIPEKWFKGIRVSEQPQDINRNNARKWKDLETYINDRESFKK